MKKYIWFPFILALHFSILLPFSNYMQQRPLPLKVGYVPRPWIVKALSGDQQPIVGAFLVMKVLFYFGSLPELKQKGIKNLSPDLQAMHDLLWAAVHQDPYNMDAYYFAQATFSWDKKFLPAANKFLDYGMQYRDWDFYLPFFAGFNYSYFLKDYPTAARHFKRAQELTGSDLFGRLASRYMYESGQTEMAIAYLKMMVKGAKNRAIKTIYQQRLDAVEQVRIIEIARDSFFKEKEKYPQSLSQLVEKGYLKEIPTDPYGGKYYIDERGMIRSTSKFAPLQQHPTE